ncbi:MAG: YcnI family protein [Brevundimonas sp.]
MPSALRTLGATAVAGLALALLPAGPASAHVRVIPESTAAGGWTVLTFRVPNEDDSATTTKVVLDLPTTTPLTHVGIRPVPGWTAEVQTATLATPVDVEGATITEAPSHVVFTASPEAAIGVGQFQEFELQVGPLPAEGTDLVIPAHQTYSDGTVVDWDQPATGDAEPDRPAPELTITAADDSESSSPGAEPVIWFALGGLALGLVAAVVALVTGRRRGVQP